MGTPPRAGARGAAVCLQGPPYLKLSYKGVLVWTPWRTLCCDDLTLGGLNQTTVPPQPTIPQSCNGHFWPKGLQSQSQQ